MKKIHLIIFLFLFNFFNKIAYSSDEFLKEKPMDGEYQESATEDIEDIEVKSIKNPSFFSLIKISKMVIFTLLILSLISPAMPLMLGGAGIVFNPQIYDQTPDWALEKGINITYDLSNHTNITESYYFEPENIFGEDKRVGVNSEDFPYSGIGKILYQISSGSSYSCTGELISREHLLTNAHCLFEDKKDSSNRITKRFISDNWKKSFKFYPAFENGMARDSASWKSVIYSKKYEDLTNEAWEQDWAIIHLDKALGDYFSQFVLRNFKYSDYNNFDEKINLVGYSGDRFANSAGGHFNCEIHGSYRYSFGTQVIHDCDSTKGSSGSGLYFISNEDGSSVANIVAIHHASIVLSSGGQNAPDFSTRSANLACETEEAYEAFQIFRNNTEPNPPYDGPEKDRTRQYIMLYTLGIGGGACVLTCFVLTLKKICKDKRENMIPKFNDSNGRKEEGKIVEIEV